MQIILCAEVAGGFSRESIFQEEIDELIADSCQDVRMPQTKHYYRRNVPVIHRMPEIPHLE
jgi:hypothetical protein